VFTGISEGNFHFYNQIDCEMKYLFWQLTYAIIRGYFANAIEKFEKMHLRK
jgi:hypothetical protein